MARLDVVGIAVADMAASLAFYRLLGVAVPDGAGAEGHVEVDLGGWKLAWDTLGILRDVYGGWGEATGHRIELAFQCDARDEVDHLFAAVTAAGHRGHRAPWDAVWGQRYAIVEDPDGNFVSLYAG